VELPVPQLGDGHGDSRLDLVTHVLYEEADDHGLSLDEIDFLASMARTQHERSHWPRFHGTSIGHLLNLLRHSRHTTAVTALRGASPAAAPRIRAKRHSGVPLWSIEQAYDPSVAGEGFAIMGQAWVDSYWLWNAIFDSSTLSGIRSHPDESAPYGLADAWLHSAGVAGSAEYPGNEIARAWLQGPIIGCATDHGDLTTRLLWECASTLDELLPPELEDYDSTLPVQEPILNGTFTEAHQRLAQIKLNETAYGLPARVANDCCSNLSILALLLLIDFALNPPLPMFGAAQESVPWGGFYPPERFLRCAPYGHILSSLTSSWQDDLSDLPNAYDLLSALTGLAYFAPSDATLSRVPSVRRAVDGPYAFHDALVSTSSKLLWLRGDAPAAIVLPHSSRRVARIPGFDQDPPADLPLVQQLGHHEAIALMPFGDPEVAVFLRSAVQTHMVDWMVNGIGGLEIRIPRGYSLEDLEGEALTALACSIEWPEDLLRDCLRAGSAVR